MTKKPRRFFTAEQKAEAVNIVNQSGKPVSQVAKEMGLTESWGITLKRDKKRLLRM